MNRRRSWMHALGDGSVRGFIAAFAALSMQLAPAAAAQPASGAVIANANTIPDGLTIVARRATASPTASLELWVKAPTSGYSAPRPGLARLTALAIVEQRAGGSSLRDEVRKAGGQIQISVYQESTEIALLVPAYLATSMLENFAGRALRPRLDQKAFEAARQRLAAQQVAQMDMPDQTLRDALFSRLFASGPLHDSSYGDPKTLTGLTLEEVQAFANRAYVPAGEIFVAVGGVDPNDVNRRIATLAPPSGTLASIPESTLAPATDIPLSLTRDSISESGAAVGWAGPPISDRRAATAMDFLSDYLTDAPDGVLTKLMANADPTARFVGQFVTLRNPGVFYVTAYGDKLDPTIASGLVREGVRNALARGLSGAEFERAKAAYVTHLLRDMQSAEGLADNYGWYFAQGELAYSPSATDAALSGEYFHQVASLTPDYVASVARRYLSQKPAVVLMPRGPVHISGTI